MISNQMHLHAVLKIPETHILSRPEIFKQIDIAFSFGGDGYHHPSYKTNLSI